MPARTKSHRFQITLFNRRPAREEILDDMRRLARRCGRQPFTFRVYGARGRFSPNTIAHHFGSWRAALAAAGLPTHVDRDVPTAALFDNLAKVWHRLGRQPTTRDMVKRDGLSRYALAAYESGFGSWHKALLAFADHLRGRKIAAVATPRVSRRSRPANRAPRRINWRLRARVLIRDNCLCRMCGASPAKDPAVTLHVDHIVPWSKGGRTALENLQTLCERCNVGKGNACLRRHGVRQLRQPARGG